MDGGGRKEIRNDPNVEVLPLVEDFFGCGDTFQKLREQQD